MNITLSEAQAGRVDLPVGTVVEAQIKADPYAVWAAPPRHGYSGLLTLEPDQIKDLIPFAPGLTRVVSRAGEGRSQLLWHWIKYGGPGAQDVYFVDPEGIYSGAPEDVPVRALVNYNTDAQIDRLMEQVHSGGILVIDHAERVQCDNLTDSESASPLALGQFLARLGFVAKRRGVMVIAAIQLRRLGAPSEGIRVYSPEGGDA